MFNGTFRRYRFGVQMSNNPGNNQQQYIGAGIALGVAIGVGLGVALGNLALGIGPGICIGVALGVAMSRRKRPGCGSDERDTRTDESGL
jgi:F0F1-type ATP synthase membrane subunit c/vacuolar-type H+-ATPase subunit K